MNKTLICYFSATGITKKEAEKLARILKGDLFEIEPVTKYTEEDLDWRNENSRSSIEMKDENSRPEVLNKIEHLENYDTILIGFPVWWYKAPTIINTFIEENDLTNKDIFVFVTSGSSSFEESFNTLHNTYPNLKFLRGTRLCGDESEEEILNFTKK